MGKCLLVAIILSMLCNACNNDKDSDVKTLNSISEKYIILGLDIGQYDPDFVDAYYGPDSLKSELRKDSVLPVKLFLAKVDSLLSELKSYRFKENETSEIERINYLEKQLLAFSRRLKFINGDSTNFQTESRELFDVNVPKPSEADFNIIISQLDGTLPGNGSITERLEELNKRFIIPKEKVDTIFRLAIAEARRRTLKHFDLPKEEKFTLEYVTDKPWSGYNWYKGNYTSLIQINIDQPILIDRAIDLGCHEGYPGHHVYNALLEKNLYRGKGFKEITLYPLFSPQSFIAEGSANYGIEMAFPGDEKIKFVKDVLLRVAGLDTSGITTYFKCVEIKQKLNYIRNEVARGLIDKKLSEDQAGEMLAKFGLSGKAGIASSIRFIKKYRSYVICYNYGQDLVKSYVEKAGSNINKRWELFGKLLSNPTVPSSLETAASK